jgi:REP element-mobilizing transposase RayT
MEIVHLTWSTRGRKPAFPTESARRAAVRAMADVAGREVVLFALVDDHIHVVAIGEPRRLSRVQAALARALGGRAAAPLAPAFVRPVGTRSHLEWLVNYCLTQFEHHGITENAATATGSCFADLAGARLVTGLELPLKTVLPRFRVREAYVAIGLGSELAPMELPELRRLGAARLAELVADTYCVGPGLEGNAAGVVRARRALAQLGRDAGFRPGEIADAAGITAAAAGRLLARPVPEAELHAVRLRAAISITAPVGAVMRAIPA